MGGITQLNKNMDQNEIVEESTIVEERLPTLPAQNDMTDMKSALMRIVGKQRRSMLAQMEMQPMKSEIIRRAWGELHSENEMRHMESEIVRSVAQNEMLDMESAMVRIVQERWSTLLAQNGMRHMESEIVRSVEYQLSTLSAQNEMQDMESTIVRSVAATIFKVPHTITSGQPEAYKPNFVSIGPFHHNRNFPDGHPTKAAETHKIWYLRDFLGRDGQPCKFKDYVGGILPLERKARDCYSEEVQLSSKELVEGMLLDACFIIELFLKLDEEDITVEDPIYGSLLNGHIAFDLLLLENQLPFFILEDVYKRFNKEKRSFKPLTELAMNFFSDFVPRNDAKLPAESVVVHHLLHLVYLHFEIDQPLFTSKLNFLCKYNFFPFQQRSRSSNEAQLPTRRVIIPSATLLHDAGVKFSKAKNANFLAIEFNNGRLEIPPFFLEDSSDFFLRNLIAFERLTNRKYLFSSYAYFMDRLVNTEKDIEILSNVGIIKHVLGSDEEAAVFFNRLGNGLAINFENTHLGEVLVQLNKYYRFRPRMWRAKLIRDHYMLRANLEHNYFRNPWFILSLLAALVVFVLTFIQTVFSVMQYVKPK